MSNKRRWKRLIIGIAVVALAMISVSGYKAAILRSRESALQLNLAATRAVIKQYVKDKQRAPQSLQDLVDAGYFRRDLPLDPISNSTSSWQPVVGNVVISPGKTERGITDLHSGSTAASSNGTTYNVW